jgi:glycosyltransferase involved in cell wall biosynthesis
MISVVPAPTSKRCLFILFDEALSPRQRLLVQSLKQRGWSITVLAWDRQGDAATGGDGEVDDWRWIRLPAPSWSGRLLFRLPHYYALVIKAWREIDRVALIFLTHFFLLPLALLLPGKKIYDDAEMYQVVLSFYGGRFQPLLLCLLPLLVRVLVTRVDGVTCIDSREGWLEKFYRRWTKHVQVLWNVPARGWEEAGSEPPAVDSLAGRRLVAYVGGLMKEKGLRVALAAAARVREVYPQVLFVFIGPMKDDADEVQKLIRAYGVSEHVLFLGPKPYAEMLQYLRLAEMGLALYQSEFNSPTFTTPLVAGTSARKFFTYMQAGIPCIGPNFGELGSVVRATGAGLLVDTTDSMAVSQAILQLLDHPAEAKRLGENGRAAFLAEYHWEREERKFLNFLAQVMNDSATMSSPR